MSAEELLARIEYKKDSEGLTFEEFYLKHFTCFGGLLNTKD